MATKTTTKTSCCGGGETIVATEGIQVVAPDEVLATIVDPVRDGGGACCGNHASDTETSDSDNPYGYADHKQDYLRRLRRIEGQVRGLQRMVDEDQYCIDILTQISAVTKALESTALRLLDEHLSHCVMHAIEAGGQEADDKLAEASAAIARLVRS